MSGLVWLRVVATARKTGIGSESSVDLTFWGGLRLDLSRLSGYSRIGLAAGLMTEGIEP
jgi:hypothetical protein